MLRDLKNFSKPILGNEPTVKILEKWFKTVASGSLPTPKYYFISALPGNGKTHLINYLSIKYQVPIVEVTSINKNNLNEAVSTRSFSSTYKVIVIDGLDNYNLKKQRELYRLKDQIPNPILYTVSYETKLDKTIVKDNNFLRLTKPPVETLLSLLKSIVNAYSVNISENKLKEIVQVSTSVRSAINSLFSDELVEFTDSYEPPEDLYTKILEGKAVECDYTLFSYLVAGTESEKVLTILSELDLGFGKKSYNKLDGYVIKLLPKQFNSTPNFPVHLQKMKNKPSDNTLYMKVARKLHLASRDIPKEFSKLLYHIVRSDKDLLDMIVDMQLQPAEIRRITKKKYIKKQHRKEQPKSNDGKSLLQYF